MYNDKDGKPVKGIQSSTLGYRAAGIPGTPAGLEYALKKYGSGKLSWAQLLEPARQVAQNGYILSNRLARLLEAYKDNLEKFEDSNRIFLRNGKYFKEGENFVQTDLAATIARMQKGGAKEFYEGQTGRMIADDMKRNGGLITLEDLKGYKVRERAPLTGSYRGYPIITMPPPSSGGIVMLQVLNMLEGHDVKGMGWASAKRYHLLAECLRRAYADRAEYMADPDFVRVPVSGLIDKEYAKQRAATISMERASKSADVKAGAPAGAEPTETTHFTVIDKEGNIVSNTYTINDLYGNGVTVKGTGVLLNDEMDDFAARPGQPNMFGLIQGERNKIEPGKRPLSSMTPTIVLRKDGSPWFALGARGGPRIITAVLQTTIHMIDFDMNIQAAMDSPRIHQQWYPDEILYEPFGMSEDTISVMKGMGHTFADRAGYVATATGIAVEEKTGVRLGAIDSRSDGEAVGY
jgi:gamma-glutamyltranspeptidase/glutathione hydrolase